MYWKMTYESGDPDRHVVKSILIDIFLIKIAFHEPHEVPQMSELSLALSPGTRASINLQKSEVSSGLYQFKTDQPRYASEYRSIT